MNLDVMLASSGKWDDKSMQSLNTTHWFDVKWDGIRCLVLIDAGSVQLINRNGVDITYRYPDLVENLKQTFPSDARLILDGEVVVIDTASPNYMVCDFKKISKRDRQSDPRKIEALAATMPVTFVAFDILFRDGRDLRDRPLSERWPELTSIMNKRSTNYVVQSLMYSDLNGAKYAVEHNGYEGLIAKSLTSTYRHGRQKAWVKFKPTQTESFVVLGMEEGTGHRADTFGALLIGQQVPGGFQFVGKVGSGFTEADLSEILEQWQDIQEGRRTDPIVVEVEYQEVTQDGSLRFPVFRGVRTDVIL